MNLATERLAYQGRRAELLQEEKSLRIAMQGLRDAMRQKLNPLLPEEELPAEELAVLGVELGLKHTSLVRNLREQSQIREILGH